MDLLEDSDDEVVADRYRVGDLIGQGGMGRVRRAKDLVLGRDVALKEIVLPVGVVGPERARILDRMRREARMAAQLNHPGIVRVHDIIEHEDAPIIVMEYLDGRSLATTIRESGPLAVGEVARIAEVIVDALAHAHAAGVVHRDLKPDNIMLTRDGRTVLTDFGIARPMDGATPLTTPGTILGTPAYMAPEQIEGKELTSAADLWSLGATLYAALEGRPPFPGESMTEICVAILTRPAALPRNAGELAPLLDALLAKDPAHRADAGWIVGFLAAHRQRAPQSTTPTGGATTRNETDPFARTRNYTSPKPAARTPWHQGPTIAIAVIGLFWIIALALPMWEEPGITYGPDYLSAWGMLTDSGVWSGDKLGWAPALAVITTSAMAAVTLTRRFSRYRAIVQYSAIAVGAVAAAALVILGILGTDFFHSQCSAAVSTDPAASQPQEYAACISSEWFGPGYYICIAVAALMAVSGLWAVIQNSRRRKAL